MKEAEYLAQTYKCDGLIVIAGVGTRNYYRNLGYDINSNLRNNGEFMFKNI